MQQGKIVRIKGIDGHIEEKKTYFQGSELGGKRPIARGPDKA